MSSSAYKGATPSDLNVDPRIVPFFERFYAVSDDPNAHEEYAQSFVPDADFTMGAKKTAGYKGILELRHGLWSGPIKTRKHTLHKIFPFGATGEGGKELMLYGTVDYGLKNGKDVTCEWAARAVMAEYEGGLRFKLYQVYVVSFFFFSFFFGQFFKIHGERAGTETGGCADTGDARIRHLLSMR